MRNVELKAAVLVLMAVADAAFAQSLPPPSRTVFKCESGGKVVYSDSPCLGATKIDVEPTRGLNKSTGRVREGHDVQRERRNEGLAEALKPLTGGKDAKQLTQIERRMRLSPGAQRQCRSLDSRIPEQEALEARASGGELDSVQRELFASRSRWRELGC